MKTIRRILAFALVLMLTMSLGVNAVAADAKYQLTRDFVSQVSGVEGLSCTIGDVVSDSTGNYELVKVDYEGELSAYTSHITMLFAEDESEVQLYMYNLINFSEDKLNEMMTVVNDLNHRRPGLNSLSIPATIPLPRRCISCFRKKMEQISQWLHSDL